MHGDGGRYLDAAADRYEGGFQSNIAHHNTPVAALHLVTDPFSEAGLVLRDAPDLRDNVGSKIPVDRLVAPNNSRQIALAVNAAIVKGNGVVGIGGRSSGTQAFGKPGLKPQEYGLNAILGLNLPVVEDPNNKDVVQPFSAYSPEAIEAIGVNQSRLFIEGDNRNTRPNMRLVTGPSVSPGGLHRLLASNQVGTYTIGEGAEAKTYRPDIEGWDLTSGDIAATGATAANGALGPTRMPPSTSIARVALARGKRLEVIDKEKFKAHEGLGGTSGVVAALELEPTLKPAYPFVFLAPVQGEWAQVYARLQTKLAPALNMRIENGIVKSDWDGGVLRGIEEISRRGLELYLEIRTAKDGKGAEKRAAEQPPAIKLARQMLKMMNESETDHLLMMPGDSFMANETELGKDNSPHNPWKELYKLAGYNEDFELTGEAHLGEIAAIVNDSTKAELLKAIRHELPELARAEGTPQHANDLRFTTSTDYIYTVSEEVLQHAPEEVIMQLRADIFAIYQQMEEEVLTLKEKAASEGVKINVYSYGHVLDSDLHRRVTAAAEDGVSDELFAKYKGGIEKIAAGLRQRLAQLMDNKTKLSIPNPDGAEEATTSEIEVSSYARRQGEKGTIKGWSEASEEVQAAAINAWIEAGPNFTYRLPPNLQSLIQEEVDRRAQEQSLIPSAVA